MYISIMLINVDELFSIVSPHIAMVSAEGDTVAIPGKLHYET